MMKKLLYLLVLLVITTPQTTLAVTMANKLSGKILVSVEEKGEAWYVNPSDQKRYYLGRPNDAFVLMKQLATGINNQTHAKLTQVVPTKLLGKIVINVENKGAAYYLNPGDSKMYSLGRPAEAFAVMRKLGTGISIANLSNIPIGKDKPVAVSTNSYLEIEKKIQDLVNDQREEHGLSRVAWNDEVAAVARQHSKDQATDNIKVINQNKLCSYPFIHHEGKDFGIYHSERLNSKGLYYFSASAENIALIPKIKSTRYDSTNIEPLDCQSKLNSLNKIYEQAIDGSKNNTEKEATLKKEISNRVNLTNASPDIKVISQDLNTIAQIEEAAVTGWMNSPGHRKNILNATYDEAGMGISEVNGYFIITQVFIKRATCGYKGGSCCQKEGYYPYCYVPWDCTKNICQ
jgi:hypothetical protein